MRIRDSFNTFGNRPLTLALQEKDIVDQGGQKGLVATATAVGDYNTGLAGLVGGHMGRAVLANIADIFKGLTAGTVSVNGLPLQGGYWDGVFSFDGLHPTKTGQALIANTFIDGLKGQKPGFGGLTAAQLMKLSDVDTAEVLQQDKTNPKNADWR